MMPPLTNGDSVGEEEEAEMDPHKQCPRPALDPSPIRRTASTPAWPERTRYAGCTLAACLAVASSGCEDDETSPTASATGGSRSQTEEQGPEANCPFPQAAANPPIAWLDEGFSDNAPDSLSLDFYGNGALRAVAQTPCDPEAHPSYDPKTLTECYQAYRCGSCLMVLGSRTLEGKLDWYLVPDAIGTADCASLDGFYRLCVPDCGSQVCGVDANGCPCGSCPEGQTCDGGTCQTALDCAPGCQVGSVCCGPPFCSGDCVGTPCC